jgi:hypothetical protein
MLAQGDLDLVVESFGEKLPDQCPPKTANDLALPEAYRLVDCAQPSDLSFASHLALGKPKPDAYKGTDCEWASCSLSSSVDSLLKIKGLRKRLKYVAKLEIPERSGRHLAESSHIHFWRFSSFSLAGAVQKVWGHGKS